MIPVRETDHYGKGKALLLEQFKNRKNIEALLHAYLGQCQILENTFWDIINSRLLNTAVGNQLDGLGDLVGESRLGRNDTDYRAAVRLRVRVNRSQGRAEDVMQVANLAAVAAGGVAEYQEFFPAVWVVTLYSVLSPSVIARMLYSTKSAATGGYLVYTDVDAAHMFTFDTSVSPLTGNRYKFDTVGGTDAFLPSVAVVSPTA